MAWPTWSSLLPGCAQEPPLQREEGPGLWLQWLSRPLKARSLPAEHIQDVGWCHLPRELAHRLLSAGRGGAVGLKGTHGANQTWWWRQPSGRPPAT